LKKFASKPPELHANYRPHVVGHAVTVRISVVRGDDKLQLLHSKVKLHRQISAKEINVVLKHFLAFHCFEIHVPASSAAAAFAP
jgi:hypothetical protein